MYLYKIGSYLSCMQKQPKNKLHLKGDLVMSAY